MIDLLISGGVGVFVTIIGRLAYDGSKFGKKPLNGYATKKDQDDCKNNVAENFKDLKITIDKGFDDAKNDRSTLFAMVHEVRNDVSRLGKEVGVLQGKID